jgi:UDP-N-acetylmuramoyl-tripeptide--D-alanyl-D-alanine ligase
MEPRTLQYIADATHAVLSGASPTHLIRGVTTDSREAGPGILFVAIRGERLDGHDFIEGAVAQQVEAILVSRCDGDAIPSRCGQLRVQDTRQALGQLAARYRQDYSLPIIAVAGSNGKTTTKELIASVLRESRATLHSAASFNNEIGVPLTLLRLEAGHQVAVLEVGTNHPGELAPLIRMAQPRFGVITSIGREHLEFFGDVTGVVMEEGTLAEMLPGDGKLFINGDTSGVDSIRSRATAATVTVGIGSHNDWKAERIRMGADGVRFHVCAPDAALSGEYRVNLLGAHQVTNALLAISIGAELGLAPAAIRAGLAACPQPKMRLQLWRANGVDVLDDCYNANADSMAAALKTLSDFPCSGRRFAVIGDMAELGEHGAAAHEEAGRRAGELGISSVIGVGRMAARTGEASRSAGVSEVHEFPDVPAAGRALRELIRPGDAVLLKASRSFRMEAIAEFLRAPAVDSVPAAEAAF